MFRLDSGEPFGLPKGTVRGVIALVFTALVAHQFVTTGTCSTELLATAGPYLGFYFGTRGSDPVAESPAEEPLGPPATGESD